MKKEEDLKEKFKQALISTVKVISDDFKLEYKTNKNQSSKNSNFFELDNLSSKYDFIKFRAETDTEALKRKFSNKEIYQKNLPNNSSCKKLYNISEKIRYELLGSIMLKGIKKNFIDNYNHKIALTRKDQLKSKDDVNITPSGLQYKVIKEGDGAIPSASDTVETHYEGTLISGEIFDSSIVKEPDISTGQSISLKETHVNEHPFQLLLKTREPSPP